MSSPTTTTSAATLNLKNISYSLRPLPQNFHCLDWGPNGFLAVAFENMVTVYDSKLNIFRCFNLHKSNITCIRFSPGSVERSLPNPFQIFLAVGDEAGNCLIYDIYNGVRYAGFSPEKLPVIPIVDVQWNPTNPSTLYVLTMAPSLLSVSVGSASRRHYSCVESWAQIGQSIQSFNLTFVFSLTLGYKFNFTLIDQYHTNQIIVASSTGANYSIIKFQSNRQTPFITQVFDFKNLLPNLSGNSKILSIEYYPHSINRLTIVLTNSICIYDMVAKSISCIYQNDMTTLTSMNNVFCAAVVDRFWVAMNDGTISCFIVDDGESYTRGSYVLIPQFHQMAKFAVDPYDPKRFAVITNDGKISVFVETKKKKIICSAYRPSFPDYIAAVASDNDKKYAFITNQGYVGVFDTSSSQSSPTNNNNNNNNNSTMKMNSSVNNFAGKMYRFKIDNNNNFGNSSLNSTESNNKMFFDRISFAGNRIAIGGNRLFVIDLYDRVVSVKNKHLTPSKLMTAGSIIAYTPFPNTLDILHPSQPKQSLAFANSIVAFNARMSDPTHWAVMVQKKGCWIVDISEKPRTVSNFAFKDESVSNLVFVGTCVYIATRIGELHKYNIDTRTFSTINVSSSMIASIKAFETSILMSDGENNTYLLDINLFKIVKSPKWKIPEAHFLSATTTSTTITSTTTISATTTTNSNTSNSEAVESNLCDNSNVDLNADTFSGVDSATETVTGTMTTTMTMKATMLMAVAQTSKTALVLIHLPSFEIYISPTTAKTDISMRFAACDSTEDFERTALEAGDLDFVHFLRTFQHLGGLPLPALFTQNHSQFVAKEKITRSIERIVQPKNMIDYLILTGQNDLAAKYLLSPANTIDSSPLSSSSSQQQISTQPQQQQTSSSSSQQQLQQQQQQLKQNEEDEGDYDEKSMLLAYACLAPNLNAAKGICRTGRHVLTCAKLFVIAGERDAAVEWLIDNKDWTNALYFLKMLYPDEIAAKKIMAWLNISKPILQLSPLILAFVGDYHGAANLLYHQGSVAKAYVMINHMKKNNIKITESPFEEFNNVSVEELIEKVESKWSSYTI